MAERHQRGPLKDHSVMWRELNLLPLHDGQAWAIWRRRAARPTDVETIRSGLRSWSPSSTQLLAGPGDRRFMPPVYRRQVRARVVDIVGRNCRLAIFCWAGFSLILVTAALFTGMPRYLSYASIFGLVTATVVIDHGMALRTAAGIGQRALFFRWLQTDSRTIAGFIAWLTLSTLAGGCQLYWQAQVGGLEALIERYGIVFSELTQHDQWWRVLTGSFFHAGLAHFANNAILLLFAGTIAWGIFGARWCLAVFILGIVVGPLAQMSLGTSEFDSYLGLSSSVFSLFGLLIVAAIRRPRVLPKGLQFTLMGIVTMSGVGAELLSEHAATAAHVAGFAAGALCGLAARTRADPRRRPAHAAEASGA